MKIANTLLALFFALLFCPTTWAFDNFKDFRKDHWDFDVSTDYYTTQSNYDSSGSEEALGNSGQYQLINVDFGSRFTWGRRTAFFASLRAGMAESKSLVTRNTTGLTEGLMGAEYLAYSGSFDIVPEVSVLIPTGGTPSGTSYNAVASESVMEIRPKVTLQKIFGLLGGYAYGGFTYRDQGRSFLLPWGVGAFLRHADSRLGAEIFGYQSVTNDKDTNNKGSRLAYIGNADAGSYKFLSFNPSLIDSNFFYHINVSGPWSFQISGGISIAGTNAADGYHAGAMIRYSFDTAASSSNENSRYLAPVPSETPRGKSQMYSTPRPDVNGEKKLNQFHEDTNDGVDQRLFKKPAAPVRPAKPQVPLQQQLDDTEMKIELKSNKGH